MLMNQFLTSKIKEFGDEFFCLCFTLDNEKSFAINVNSDVYDEVTDLLNGIEIITKDHVFDDDGKSGINIYIYMLIQITILEELDDIMVETINKMTQSNL